MDCKINGLDVIVKQIKEIDAIYYRAVKKSGISVNEFMLWSLLLENNAEYTQQELTEILMLPKQTINSIVINLSKKEYIYLETIPKTRNLKLIRLTESGRKFGEEKTRWITEAEKSAFSKMTEEEMGQCIKILSRYARFLNEEIQKGAK